MDGVDVVQRRRELTGFALYLLSFVFAIVYFSWAFFPEGFAHLTSHTAPDTYWAVAVPMW
jgi:TRAP-type mannitol/chloroaromatic compound transport system permease small subunit